MRQRARTCGRAPEPPLDPRKRCDRRNWLFRDPYSGAQLVIEAGAPGTLVVSSPAVEELPEDERSFFRHTIDGRQMAESVREARAAAEEAAVEEGVEGEDGEEAAEGVEGEEERRDFRR